MKMTYEKPTLVRREKLAAISAGINGAAGSGNVKDR